MFASTITYLQVLTSNKVHNHNNARILPAVKQLETVHSCYESMARSRVHKLRKTENNAICLETYNDTAGQLQHSTLLETLVFFLSWSLTLYISKGTQVTRKPSNLQVSMQSLFNAWRTFLFLFFKILNLSGNLFRENFLCTMIVRAFHPHRMASTQGFPFWIFY